MRKNALVLVLAALPFTACKCHGGFVGTNGTLVASPNPINFQSQGYGTKKTIHVVITNQGDAPVNITGAPTFSGDTNKAFSASFPAGDGGLNPLPIFLDLAGTTNMDVTYDPPANETDSASVNVQNDSPGPLVVPVEGKGVDPCFGVVCDAGVVGIGNNPGGCFGTCASGKCVYNGPCSDKSQCLSNGQCVPSGADAGMCVGTSDCALPGPGTCNGNVLTGDITPGSCNQGSGTCLYNHNPVTCDCGCVQNGGTASCAYQWQAVQGIPSGSASSVWSAGNSAGDLWLSIIMGTASGFNPNTVYHQVNGAWTQVGQVANAGSPLCSGPGCGLSLVGTSDDDVYGANDCITVQGGQCTLGGAWHYTGTAADESFLMEPNFPDYPLTTLIDINGTAYAINSDNSSSGPELVSGTNGTWKIAFATDWSCEAQGALWGIAGNDIWMTMGCNHANPGQIAHYNGSGFDAAKNFPLPAGEYAEGMWGTSDTDIWAAGTHRWHYDGTSWTEDPVAPPAGNADQTVWGNGSDYFAGGGYVALYHWTSAADWTQECIAPGYEDPSVYSFTSDGTNFFATTSATDGGLVQRCANPQCQ